MTRVIKNVLCGAVLVCTTAFVTQHVVSQDHQDPGAEMEMWLKLAEPGPEHAQILRGKGKWNQVSTHWMYPGAEPTVSESIATRKPILGGRFLLDEMKGSMDMGQGPVPFEGMGIIGFDNLTKKHFYVWLDSMGTLAMKAEGTADASGDVVTYMSEMPMPDGQIMKMKSVATHINADKSKFEMYTQTPEGWFKNMEVVSTRR